MKTPQSIDQRIPVVNDTEVEIPVGADLNKNHSIEQYRIDPLAHLNEPPTIISIGDAPAMTAGNFSLLIGKAKSAKTFFIGAIVAAFLSLARQLNIIKGKPIYQQGIVLYFDTEQSTYHATRSIQRICKLIGNPNPDNLIAYALRSMTPAERTSFIDEKILTTDSLGLVIIDGGRDLLTNGINDETEATSLTSKFLKWTTDYNIHLIVVLHQNKNDNNARGHIGTELVNKAEAIISTTKRSSGSFVVSNIDSRDIGFEDFAFLIEDGLPVSCDIPQKGQVKPTGPEEVTDEEHRSKLEEIFKDSKKLDRVSFENVFRNEYSIGDNNSRDWIKYIVENKWVKKEREGKRVLYSYGDPLNDDDT